MFRKMGVLMLVGWFLLLVSLPGYAQGDHGYQVSRLCLTDDTGERIAYVRPGQKFTVEAIIALSDKHQESRRHEFAQIHLYIDGNLTALYGTVLSFSEPEVSLTASFVAPDDVSANLQAIVVLGEPGAEQTVLSDSIIPLSLRPRLLEPGRVMTIDATWIEIEEHGVFALSDYGVAYQHFYGVKDSIRTLGISEIMVGAKDVVLSTVDNRVVQIDVLSPQYLERIRVGLMSDQFASLEHDEVTLSSQGRLTIEDQTTTPLWEIPANTPTVFRVQEGLLQVVVNGIVRAEFDSRVYLVPELGSKIRIESFYRGSGAGRFQPEYRGIFELTATDEDNLQIVNELPLEQYLYNVVPSEMPVSWHPEALKAQAVAARTFALRSALDSQYGSRGFHVDDSVTSQVYNNHREANTANQAIDETKGVIMVSALDNKVVKANFHSTSSGMTATSAQVWNDFDGSFPGKDVPYLQARSVTEEVVDIDLSHEENAYKFFTATDLASYDSSSPWFRWSVSLSGRQLTNTINANLAARFAAQPDYVLTKDDDGRFVASPISEAGIGEISDLQVIERGDGGNIMVLEIKGANGTVRIYKEYNIRFVLRPSQEFAGGEDVILRRHLPGTDVANYPILPSTFVVFDIERDLSGVIRQISFYGGGNGHGVGMSQYGAKGMAEENLGFEQILTSFYSDVELVDIKGQYR